jgi:hypothetical protein
LLSTRRGLPKERKESRGRALPPFADLAYPAQTPSGPASGSRVVGYVNAVGKPYGPYSQPVTREPASALSRFDRGVRREGQGRAVPINHNP